MCKASCRIFPQPCGEVIRLLFHCNNTGLFGMIRATNWTFMNNLLAVFVGDSSGSGALAIKSSSSSSTLPNVPSKSSETIRSKWSSSFPLEKYVISISSASWKVRRISDSLPLSGPMLLLICFSSQSKTLSPPFCTFPLQCTSLIIALPFPPRSKEMQLVPIIRNVLPTKPTTNLTGVQVQVYMAREGLSAANARSVFLRLVLLSSRDVHNWSWIISNNNNSLLISLSQPEGWITRKVSDTNRRQYNTKTIKQIIMIKSTT